MILNGADNVSGTNSAPTSDKYWDKAYEWLRKVNILISKGENYSTQEEIAAPVGQAYFFRAWHHFFLLKRYGGDVYKRQVMNIGMILENNKQYADGKGREYYIDYVLNRSSIRQWSLTKLADYGLSLIHI